MFRRFLVWSALVAMSAVYATAAHATLSGTITDVGTTLPLAQTTVRLLRFDFPEPVQVGSTTTDAAGHYTFDVGDDEYTVELAHPGHLRESHYVQTSGATVFDRAMSVPARIRGHVRDGSGAPIASAPVSIEWIDRPESIAHFDAVVPTGSDGSYDVPDQHAGTYRLCVVTMDDGFRDVCHDRRSVPIDGSLSDFTPVPLASGAVRDVDFALSAGASIRGVLADVFHVKPIAGDQVGYRIHDADGEYLTSGHVIPDETGHYAVGGLPAGTYTLVFGGAESRPYYTPRVFGADTCDPACSFANATRVVVPADTSVVGIDVELHPGAVLSGRVTSADGEPLVGVDVAACTEIIIFIGSVYREDTERARTDAGGRYEIAHLRGRPTRVGTFNHAARLEQNYPGVTRPPHLGACYLDNSEFPLRTDEVRTDIDFALDPGAAIEGQVRDVNGAPQQARIVVRDDLGRNVFHGESGIDGRYVSTGLPSGTYYAHAYDDAALTPCQLYSGIGCGFVANPPIAGATPLTLQLPLRHPGVDFTYTIDRVFRGRFE